MGQQRGVVCSQASRTKDERDTENPYKHLPNYEYFDALHAAAESFNVLFVEKSRTMIMDEAAFIENGAEAFDVAISSKVPKVKVISSAAPGWFYNITKNGAPVELPEFKPLT
jgi:hypothetical protein